MERRSKLTELREAKCWTLMQAAQAVGVSINTIHRWEMGKQKPHGYNLQQLCLVYGVEPEELELDNDGSSLLSVSHAPLLTAFIAGDLTMRLLELTAAPLRSLAQTQKQVSVLLEEFDAMNIDPMTRREALRRLVALSVTPLSFPQSAPTRLAAREVLSRQSASIAACLELGRSTDVVDLAWAFEGATAALQRLKPIVKDPRYHKAAATLAARAADLQTVFGRHLQGPQATIQYGKQAVSYGKEADNIPEYLGTFIALAWTYYDIPQYSVQALQTMEQAASIANEQRTRVPLYIRGRVYSALAVMQARNGLSATSALKEATKNAFADQGYAIFVDDPVWTLIKNEAYASYHQGEHSSALESLSQLIDVESKDNNGNLLLAPKRATMSEREYLGALGYITLLSLKTKDKDLERSVFLWKAWAQRVKALKSERYFAKVVLAYEMMETLWGDDQRVQELRPLTTHW